MGEYPSGTFRFKKLCGSFWKGETLRFADYKSTSNSTIILNIYEAGKDGSVLETKNAADQMLYEGLMKEVSGIKDIFSIIIDIVDKDIAMQKTSINTRLQLNNGIADELTKLVKLKESGYLSEEEFNIQKSRLLN